jgi:hypothetical protein
VSNRRATSSLPQVVKSAPAVEAVAAPSRRPSVASPLAASPLLTARVAAAAERERIVAAVEFLRSRNGVADAAAFAAELGEFAARVSGLVSRLQEVLNVDGYQVLRYDRQNKQVHLDVDKLAQQFELTL